MKSKTESALTDKFRNVWPHLDERTRRLVAASEALSLGFGGVALVHRASGLSRQAIARGIGEIRTRSVLNAGRVRRSGGGRKSIEQSDPGLLDALDQIIQGYADLEPRSPLRWICQSTREIAWALRQRGHTVSYVKVAQLLRAQHYRLRGSGGRHGSPANGRLSEEIRFRRLCDQVRRYLDRRLPVVAIEIDRAYPARHEGARLRENAREGVQHAGQRDAFPAELLRDWWRAEGSAIYGKARRMLIVTDVGAASNHRWHRWDLQVEHLLATSGVRPSTVHIPPGISRWNEVERLLFAIAAPTRATISLIAPPSPAKPAALP
jgi:DDE family transposase